MGDVGNRIRLEFERPGSEIVEQFRKTQAPDLADAMHRTGAMRRIRPVYRPVPKCVGTALTVKVPAGDSLMIRKAMVLARPGDVIVIDGRGSVSRAVWGGNRSRLAARRGVAGVIIDGAARDVEECREAGLPLFARGVCPMASGSSGPGEINYPIACGGIVVCPGDIVVADAEGIAVVPRADAPDVLAAWRKVAEKDRARRAAADAGEQVEREEVERALERIGSEIRA